MPERQLFVCPGCQRRFQIPTGAKPPALCPQCQKAEDDSLQIVDEPAQPAQMPLIVDRTGTRSTYRPPPGVFVDALVTRVVLWVLGAGVALLGCVVSYEGLKGWRNARQAGDELEERMAFMVFAGSTIMWLSVVVTVFFMASVLTLLLAIERKG